MIRLGKIVPWLQDRITNIMDLVREDQQYLWKPPSTAAQLENNRKFIKTCSSLFACDKSFSEILPELRKLCKHEGVKLPKVMKDLRILLTGYPEGPPLKDIIDLLGREEALLRFNQYK